MEKQKKVSDMTLDEKLDTGYVVMIEKTAKKTGEVTRTPYETVACRLAQFRENPEHKDWTISIKQVERYDASVLMGCSIFDLEGKLRSYAEAEEPFNSYFPTVEKASTDAMGRALAQLGYATATIASYDEMQKQGIPRTESTSQNRQRQYDQKQYRQQQQQGQSQGNRQQKKGVLPDTSKPGWEHSKAGFQKTGALTWFDLANDATLPNGKSGKEYLENLANWEEKPEIARVAACALQLVGDLEEDMTTPPF